MSNDFSTIPIDDLLQQLKDSPAEFSVTPEAPKDILPPVSSEPISEENVGEYVIKKTTALIDQSMEAFKDIKSIATSTNDPDTIEALASLIKSVNSTLDTLNKINIQNKKSKTSKEVANIQAEARVKSHDMIQPIQNGILTVATRDDIIKIIEESRQKPQPTIDIEATKV